MTPLNSDLSERGLAAAREAFKQARQEVEYFGASEDFTRSPLEAAISAYLDAVESDETHRGREGE